MAEVEVLFVKNMSGTLNKEEEPISDSLSFKQLFMPFIEICLRNVWHLKIKSTIGPLFVIGASTLVGVRVRE
jgi:hypothetical protein